MVHELADVQSNKIGLGTRIWQFVVVLSGAKIGEECNICSHCYIENNVLIGNRVTVKSGVQIWDGITIENNVFIGANVTFTNDKYPKSGNSIGYNMEETLIKSGASIGAGSTILPGLTIGCGAVIGAGSVVTKCIGDNEMWFGNPATYKGVVS